MNPGLTLGELLQQWWPVKRPTVSPSTARDWESCLRIHIEPFVSDVPLHKLRAFDLDRLYRSLGERGVGPARIRRVHTILSTALGQAVRWEMLAMNPALSASPPEVRQRDISPPSPEVVVRFYRDLQTDDPDLAVFIWMASATGARRGELCALRWSDVDFEGAALLIARALVDGGDAVVEKDTKTHQARRIALGSDTIAQLAALRRKAEKNATAAGVTLSPSAHVFASSIDGSMPWRPDSTTHRFIGARRRLGLPKTVRLHDFRHFLATQLISSGVDVRTVSGRLGHRRTSTTMDRYAAFVPAADRAAANILEAHLGVGRESP